MSFTSIHLTNLHFHPKPTQISQFRVRRRGRLKRNHKIYNHLGDTFNSFISNFPSSYATTAIGLASAFALSVSSQFYNKNQNNSSQHSSEQRDWILLTTPTPFNRFVLLRCPSITFQGTELLQDVNQKLVTEDRHFVKLNIDNNHQEYNSDEEKLVYQRVCVTMEDGGVVSLDWPANLDLREEHGLDTTVFLVPGTPQGSMDKNVRLFVCESLRRGCFPVVMNPRGCAASPLTTPRLFTAADSNDICTAVQFVNNARPWSTMMAVGWGYGANMLTKYLAEVAERTPLMAAACIDNPFDLEEATRSFPHHIALDQKLTSGLIDILQSNRELFQGRAKGFNVEKALSATSLRDFEREISMVSYGFEAIEEFYAKSSTRELVGNLKVPVLFIQSDDGTVPPFSIPRSSIGENPFTSVLLYSFSPFGTLSSKKSPISWCQHFAFEWLTAVELGLLKGRHPLLKDVDITIDPPKGLGLVEGDIKKLDTLYAPAGDPLSDLLEGSDTTANVHPGSWKYMFEGAKSQGDNDSDMPKQSSSVDAELVEDMGDDLVNDETSEVLQTAQVVMNMLDVTLPGALEEEQKKKVLTAMEQGETFLKALQGAVPDDVRGKLTASVSEILQNKRRSLDLDKLMKIGSQIPNSLSEVKSTTGETLRDISSAVGGHKDVHSSEQSNISNEMSGSTDNKQSDIGKRASELELDSSDQEHPQSENTQGKGEFSGEHPSTEYDSNGPLTEHKASKQGEDDKEVESHDVGKQERVNQMDGMIQGSTNEANVNQKNEEKNLDRSTNEDSREIAIETEESQSPGTSSPEPSLIEKEVQDCHQNENQLVEGVEKENSQNSPKSEEPSPLPTSNLPSVSVSQALDALTGFDDSTQVAVNSVFGVLEDMIDQFEEGNGQENEGNVDETENSKPSSASEASTVTSETKFVSGNKGHSENGLGLESGLLKPSSHPVKSFCQNFAVSHEDASNSGDAKQFSQSSAPYSKDNAGSFHGNVSSNHGNKKDKQTFKDLTDLEYSGEKSGKVRYIPKSPLYVTVNPYGDYLYKEYLREYLLSKMPDTKSLDLDSTACLLLDYIPEDGQWKLLDQPGDGRDSVGNFCTNKSIDGRGQVIVSPTQANATAEIIETSYVVLNNENEQKPIKEYKVAHSVVTEEDAARSNELVNFVKNIVFDSLTIEVCRKLGLTHIKQMDSILAHDLEQVAEEVSHAMGHSEELTFYIESKEPASGKFGTLNGERVIKKVSRAVKNTSYLRKVLPVGVIVGSTLASLRRYFNVATEHDNDLNGVSSLGQDSDRGAKFYGQVGGIKNVDELISRKGPYSGFESSISRVNDRSETVNNSTVMVGAVTAALGASALLVQQGKKRHNYNGSAEIPCGSLREAENQHKVNDKSLDVVSEKSQNSIVSSLAEKAMSVAGPVVPTKNDGGVDQERLVAMLADWGQKGGFLRLIGKVALLWGGIRGAMSLTERIISFLRIADRPLFQRILGFAGMVLVLWSPVVIPLFPTLVQSWASHTSSGIAVYASTIGLYTAMMLLIMIWGRRIRGYKDPFKQYGLDLTSLGKLYDFSKGLVGGFSLVLSIHSINVILGYAHFSLSANLPLSSTNAMAWFKICASMLSVAGQGIVTATTVAIVEELLFRSWLPEEIAVDLSYHHAIIISGLAFSLLQRSPGSIPGMWLLSLALSGVRERSKGSLSVPIGIHGGIVASNFIIKAGGFLFYVPNCPQWLTGKHPLQPFGGAVGLALCLILAILLYPRQPQWRAIREE